ncbi:MAG: TrmB family transcriptional regulator [Desulfobacteraceae bacterium 4572_89]|nr:MAG: TrmB family transcriptional regulator [Desulfobacteraceae bacterium 4572_89]
MDLKGILNNFKALGFTEYEGKVYLSLLGHNPSSAYNISQNSGVPHSRVYDITRRLIKKKYVVSQGTNPELYSPIGPEELIGTLKRDNARLTGELQKQLESINFEPDFDPVWNLSGPKEAIEVSLELIESAQKEIYIGLWDKDLKIFKDALHKRHNDGVKVYILIYGSMELDFGNVFYHSVTNIEDVKTNGTTLDLVIDSKACVTGNLGGAKKDQVVWTKNKGLVKSIEGYLIHDFFISEIGKKFGNEIDKAFGHNLAKLRKKYKH